MYFSSMKFLSCHVATVVELRILELHSGLLSWKVTRHVIAVLAVNAPREVGLGRHEAHPWYGRSRLFSVTLTLRTCSRVASWVAYGVGCAQR